MSEQDPENKEDTSGAIVCDEVLDIAVAAELRDILLQALQAGQPVTLDGSTVTRADTAALQVLLAFFQDARSQGIPVRWAAPSPALIRSAALLGVGKLLDLSEDEAA